MTTVQPIENKYTALETEKTLPRNNSTKDDGNIFENFARKKGMDGLANFLSDDWSANMARKAGWDNFADWIDNKESVENPEEAKKEGFISKSLRAMVKHPVLTIVSIATLAFCGVKLYNHLNKTTAAVTSATTAAAAVDDTIKATAALKPVIKPQPELEPTEENIKMITEKINAGLIHEKEINFANLEILQGLPEEERKRAISYLNYHWDDAKSFLAFATGEAPATLQCVDSNYHNVFRGLRSDDIGVANLFWDKGGELVYSQKAVRKIISNNIELFRTRLGLAAEATVDDIIKELFSCSYNSPLRNQNKTADLMELILGNDIYDACHKQIVKDIKKVEMIFYPGCAGSLDEYKTILKKSIIGKHSSYSTMPQSFKDDLIKRIDAIPEEAFKSRITEPIEFLREPKSELEKFKRLVRLAKKLEDAQKHGTKLKFE